MHLKKKGYKAFKHSRSQALTEKHTADRKAFCEWFLEQEEDFPQKIIFGDEKIFRLHSIFPNRQNTRIWKIVNPHVVDDVNNQGQKNYMCSVMFFDGRVLEPFWFVDEEGKKFNCNQETYLECLEDHFLPQLTSREKRRAFFQQDGENYFKKNPYLLAFALCGYMRSAGKCAIYRS